MSAITADWTLPQTDVPTGAPSQDGKKLSREEEFGSALDGYIAEYAEYQKHRADVTRSTSATGRIAERFVRSAGWLRHRAAARNEQGEPNMASRRSD